MSDELVLVERAADGVALVTIAAPPVNAMSSPAREQLLRVMDGVQEDPETRAIVLTGRGKVFSAGADIKEKAALAKDGVSRRRAADRLTRDSFYCLLDSEKPIVAAVNGPAVGAGCVMAVCCDIVVAADNAFFAMPEIDVGQAGGGSFLQSVLPRQTMRYMLLTGARVSPEEMYRVGAVFRVVEREAVLAEAVGIAAVIAAKSPVAVQVMRGMFQPVSELGLREGFAIEQRYTAEISRSPEASAGREAFLRRREADRRSSVESP